MKSGVTSFSSDVDLRLSAISVDISNSSVIELDTNPFDSLDPKQQELRDFHAV